MNHSEAERLPDRARHEIVVDDALDAGAPAGPSFMTPIVLFAALLLSLLLSRVGVHFFFLPIIIPFGLGGRKLLGRFLPPPRRVLRLQDGLLWLASEGPLKTTILDRLNVGAGAFVALGTTGLWVAGQEDARVRVVSSDGALTIPVRGGERARVLREQLGEVFEADAVSALEHEAPLQGDVWAEPFEAGTQLEWSSGAPSSSLFGARSATALRVTPAAWALRVRSGGRPVLSTGGPGVLEARLVPAEQDGPLAASIAQGSLLLALFAGGENVGQIGTELSEPELRWIALRIERATRLQH